MSDIATLFNNFKNELQPYQECYTVMRELLLQLPEHVKLVKENQQLRMELEKLMNDGSTTKKVVVTESLDGECSSPSFMKLTKLDMGEETYVDSAVDSPLIEETSVDNSRSVTEASSDTPLVEDATPSVEETSVDTAPLVEETSVDTTPPVAETLVDTTPSAEETHVVTTPPVEETSVDTPPIEETTVNITVAVDDDMPKKQRKVTNQYTEVVNSHDENLVEENTTEEELTEEEEDLDEEADGEVVELINPKTKQKQEYFVEESDNGTTNIYEINENNEVGEKVGEFKGKKVYFYK